jgi:hypothetical protein
VDQFTDDLFLLPSHCLPPPPNAHQQGNREVIDGMAPGSAKVLESVLKMVDAYDLYGR